MLAEKLLIFCVSRSDPGDGIANRRRDPRLFLVVDEKYADTARPDLLGVAMQKTI